MSKVSTAPAHPHERLHLAVVLHESDVPFELTSGLSDDAPDPANMPPATDLWLLSRFGRFVVHWSDRDGWSRRKYS